MKYACTLVAWLAATAASVGAAPLCRRGTLFDGTTVGAWWGQSTHQLSEVCSSSSYDIVYLSFLKGLNPPAINLGKDNGLPSAAQTAKGWTGLFDATVAPSQNGSSVADQIKGCQTMGKKVMISFGGDLRFCIANFTSAPEAVQSADYLWDLFLGGSGEPGLRPFGDDVVLDGVDLDNETGDGSFYPDFVKELRAKMATDSSKSYLLSGCPENGALGPYTADSQTSIPDSILPLLDFVNVQFYNNPAGGVLTPQFPQMVQKWSQKIAAANNNTKMMVSVPGNAAAAFQGAMTPDQAAQTVASVKAMNLTNFGGFAIWDAGYAMDNPGFAEAIKKAL